METDIDLQNQNTRLTNTDNSDTTINDNAFVNDITGSDNSPIIIEQITPEVSNVKEGNREQFKINFETTLTANLKDWQINTKLNKKLDKNIIAVNGIAKEILKSIESPNYHDCLIYATACNSLACKAYIQDIQYRKKLGNTSLRLFEYTSTILKQGLKSKSEKLIKKAHRTKKNQQGFSNKS